MFPHPETYAAVRKIEHAHALRHAERRAQVAAAAKQSAATGVVHSPRGIGVRRLAVACGLALGSAVPASAATRDRAVRNPGDARGAATAAALFRIGTWLRGRPGVRPTSDTIPASRSATPRCAPKAP